jgi:hypothetical protein
VDLHYALEACGVGLDGGVVSGVGPTSLGAERLPARQAAANDADVKQ